MRDAEARVSANPHHGPTTVLTTGTDSRLRHPRNPPPPPSQTTSGGNEAHCVTGLRGPPAEAVPGPTTHHRKASNTRNVREQIAARSSLPILERDNKRWRRDGVKDIPRGYERESPAKRYVGKGPDADPDASPPRPPPDTLAADLPVPRPFLFRTTQPRDDSPDDGLPRDPSPMPQRRHPSPRLGGDNPTATQIQNSPIENHPFFLDAPAAATARPSAAPPHIAASPAADPPPSPSIAATPGPEIDDATMDDESLVDAPPAFTSPTRAEWLTALPKNKELNPHRPSTAHDPADPHATTSWTGFQNNEPGWTAPIIPDHIALQNMSDDVREAISAAPDRFLAVTVFCGGSVLTEAYKNMRTDIASVLEEVAGEDKLTLIRPQAKTATKGARRGPAGKPEKFAPPHGLIARCSDAHAREKLTRQGTYGVNHVLGFHITAFNAALLSWALGFFRTDITDTPATAGRRLCYAAYQGWRKAPKLLGLIDRATQGGSTLSRDQHVLDFALTLNARYIPHETDPVYVLMAQPCTKDAALWDEIRTATWMIYVDDLEAFTPHVNAVSGHNICADCKLDCHPKYNCMFTVRDLAWWGPRDLPSALKYLRGGESDDDDDEGDRREAPRGRGHAGRNRGRYNGRR
ncbi:hypothetical protein C8R45DRAFT_935764 [Mycena sanguinolenta]|nr:hypothetical protein C8R45DRAFT_935764 [Mycena sanguinolenta]